MSKSEFLRLMKFPSEWEEWGMYPEELFKLQFSAYSPGKEEGSEHDRNGAFHWWLANCPNSEALLKLAKLSWLDPDQVMADDARKHIARAQGADSLVEAACRNAT